MQQHHTIERLRLHIAALLLERTNLYAERQQLYAENTDLREEVQERRAQVGTLTIELEEVQAAPKAHPVRVNRVEDNGQ